MLSPVRKNLYDRLVFCPTCGKWNSPPCPVCYIPPVKINKTQRILDYLSSTPDYHTVRELSQITGINERTVYRAVNEADKLGLIEKILVGDKRIPPSTKAYRIKPRH